MPTASRFRCEKTAAAALAAAPAVWLAWLAYDGGLGARPVTEAIRISGDWALRLLWLVLLIGPARRILGLPRLVRGRRILGVGAFGLARAAFRPLCPRPAVRLARRSPAKRCCGSI